MGALYDSEAVAMELTRLRNEHRVVTEAEWRAKKQLDVCRDRLSVIFHRINLLEALTELPVEAAS